MFTLTKNDYLEFETYKKSPNTWDAHANIDLTEGGESIWYNCNNVKGIVVSRILNENLWYAYHIKDEKSIDESLIEMHGDILCEENVNDLVKKVDKYVMEEL